MATVDSVNSESQQIQQSDQGCQTSGTREGDLPAEKDNNGSATSSEEATKDQSRLSTALKKEGDTDTKDSSENNRRSQNGGNQNSIPTDEAENYESPSKNAPDEGPTACSDSAGHDSVKYRRNERENRNNSGDLETKPAPPIVKNRGNLFLRKRGPFAKWKSYHVVLDDKQFQINFYKSSDDYEKLASCKSAIDLRFVERIVPLKQGILKTNFPFKLHRRAGLSTVKVASESEEERAKWINTLEDLIHKISGSPDRDSSSVETQRASTLPMRGISMTTETQTSDNEGITAASAPEDDVQIRPKKLSKQGVKLDLGQLSSIKLKRIDSEKEDGEIQKENKSRESYDPEEKFGVQLRRISSERRSTSPKSPSSEKSSELKIKFNSLKRTKSPIIPMSGTLRNTVGDITKQERLSPSHPRAQRRASETSGRRSPSPNIPISVGVKSVMKKSGEDQENEIIDRVESKVCNSATEQISQAEAKALEQPPVEDSIKDVQNNVHENIRNTLSKKNEELEKLIALCDDGTGNVEIKKEFKRAVSVPASVVKEQKEKQAITKAEAHLENNSQNPRLHSEPKQIDIIEKRNEKKVHRSFSSITITNTVKSSTPTIITIKNDNLIQKEEKDRDKNLPLKDSKTTEQQKKSTDNIPSQNDLQTTTQIKTEEISENLHQDSNIATKKDILSTEELTTIASSEVTIAEIKFIDPEDEMQTLDSMNYIPTDNIKDFLNEMIDSPIENTKSDDKIKMQIKDDLSDNAVLEDSKLSNELIENLTQGGNGLSDTTLVATEKIIGETPYTECEDNSHLVQNEGSSTCDSTEEIQEPKLKIEPQSPQVTKGDNKCKSPLGRKNSTPLYKMFNTIESDQASDGGTIPTSDSVEIDVQIEKQSPDKQEAYETRNTSIHSIIRRENSLSVEDQNYKRPSDISLGSSECDEPLPNYCFMGSDRSSSGSGILKSIINAAEEQLRNLPPVDGWSDNQANGHKTQTKDKIAVKIVDSGSEQASEKIRESIREDSDSKDSPEDVPFVNEGSVTLASHELPDESDYFPDFNDVQYRKSSEDCGLTVPESNEALRTSGINGLKEYLDDGSQEVSEDQARGAAISRLGHSVAIEKLRKETT